MNSLLLSTKVVFPLCAYMVLGYGLKKWLKLSEETLKQINALIFKVFLPTMLFKNVYASDLSSNFNMSLLIYALSAIGVCFTILCFVIPRFEKDRRKCSVIIQGIYRSNYVIFGIPVTTAVYGADHLGMAALVAAFAVPLFNILAVLVFELFGHGKLDIVNLVKGVITNPLVLSSALGGLLLFSHIKLSAIIMSLVCDTGQMATPLALIVLGATFQFKSIHKYGRQLIGTVAGRLVLVPAIFLSIGIALGFRHVNLVVLMTLFAAPTAVSSFIMAEQMGGDGELAGQVVIISSVASVITIFMWTYLLKVLQLI
jgi:predicted permease